LEVGVQVGVSSSNETKLAGLGKGLDTNFVPRFCFGTTKGLCKVDGLETTSVLAELSHPTFLEVETRRFSGERRKRGQDKAEVTIAKGRVTRPCGNKLVFPVTNPSVDRRIRNGGAEDIAVGSKGIPGVGKALRIKVCKEFVEKFLVCIPSTDVELRSDHVRPSTALRSGCGEGSVSGRGEVCHFCFAEDHVRGTRHVVEKLRGNWRRFTRHVGLMAGNGSKVLLLSELRPTPLWEEKASEDRTRVQTAVLCFCNVTFDEIIEETPEEGSSFEGTGDGRRRNKREVTIWCCEIIHTFLEPAVDFKLDDVEIKIDFRRKGAEEL
jgi:hypothetical protein